MKHLLQFLSKRTPLTNILLLLTIIIYSQKLDAERSIRIDDSGETMPSPGTIRFNASTNDFEGWHGLYWASLTGNQYEIDEMTDQDGNSYLTVVIGTQEWMATNLRTTTYRDGNTITLVKK